MEIWDSLKTQKFDLAIDVKTDALPIFCQRYGIVELALFGKVLTNDLLPNDRVEVLLEFKPGFGLTFENTSDINDELRQIFGRVVSPVELRFVENPLRRLTIVQTKKSLWIAFHDRITDDPELQAALVEMYSDEPDDIIQLLKHGLSPDKIIDSKDDTLLMDIAWFSVDAVRVALERGGDPTLCNCYGNDTLARVCQTDQSYTSAIETIDIAKAVLAKYDTNVLQQRASKLLGILRQQQAPGSDTAEIERLVKTAISL